MLKEIVLVGFLVAAVMAKPSSEGKIVIDEVPLEDLVVAETAQHGGGGLLGGLLGGLGGLGGYGGQGGHGHGGYGGQGGYGGHGGYGGEIDISIRLIIKLFQKVSNIKKK